VCVSVSVSLCLGLSLSRSLCVFLFLFLFLFLSFSFSLSLSLSLFLSLSSPPPQAEWETLFADTSLTLVACRKSFYGSALFLCRRRLPAKPPVFIPVDAGDYQWVEPLKVRRGHSRLP